MKIAPPPVRCTDLSTDPPTPLTPKYRFWEGPSQAKLIRINNMNNRSHVPTSKQILSKTTVLHAEPPTFDTLLSKKLPFSAALFKSPDWL